MMEARAGGRSLSGAIAALVLPAVVFALSCGEGVVHQNQMEKTVPIGCMIGLTGPVGGPSQYAYNGLADYFDYFNETQQIPGVELELFWIDTGTDEPRQISAYQRFLAAGTPLILTVVDTEPFVSWVARDKVPVVALAQTEAIMYPPGWIYSVYPTWAESFAVWCEWLMDNWEEDRAPRLVLMGPDTVAGPAALEPARSYVEKLGVELLPTEYVAGYNPLDTSTQLVRAQDNGADHIFVLPLWTTAAIILKDADRLGIIGKINFGGLENTQSEAFIQQVGAAGEGYSAPRYSPFWNETEIEGIKLLHDLRKKYGRDYDFVGDDAHGLEQAAVACEALKRAIEKVGMENLDGTAVKEALESMKGFDVYGIKQITYTAEDHRGCDKVRIYEIRGGQVVPVSDWMGTPMIMP